MKQPTQHPAILIKDPKTGAVTHALIQDTETGEKKLYNLTETSFEEIAELLK